MLFDLIWWCWVRKMGFPASQMARKLSKLHFKYFFRHIMVSLLKYKRFSCKLCFRCCIHMYQVFQCHNHPYIDNRCFANHTNAHTGVTNFQQFYWLLRVLRRVAPAHVILSLHEIRRMKEACIAFLLIPNTHWLMNVCGCNAQLIYPYPHSEKRTCLRCRS